MGRTRAPLGRITGSGRGARGRGASGSGSVGAGSTDGAAGSGSAGGIVPNAGTQCQSQSSSSPSNPLPNVVREQPTLPSETESQPTTQPSETETEPGVEVGQKRKEPPISRSTSVLWETFTKCKLPNSDKIDDSTCTCNVCGARVPCDPKRNGTSSMWNHVYRRCSAHPLHGLGQGDPKQTKLNTENVTGGRPHKYSKKRCDDKCIEMIIRDELPFRHVEKEGFKAFVKELQPEWTPLNRKQVAQGVLDKFNYEKGLLLSGLKAVDARISITTDTWTSIQNINYMVLTAHFLDSEWILHKRILCFCPIVSHKGDDIGRLLDHCLRQWEITKVFTITVDNASANDVAVLYMKRRWRLQKSLLLDGDYVHLRCGCHIINLVVKDGLKELEDGISAIQNCVKYVRSSSSRLDKFREFAVMEKCGAGAKANVPLDVVTRWNSTYLMLEAALKYEAVFARMAEEDVNFMSYFENDERVGPPAFDDWRNAEAFCVFLKKFYDATLRLSAWKTVTANVLFVEMITLQCEIDKACSSEDVVLQKVAKSMKTKFQKYWGGVESMNKVIMIANVLDPRYKLQWAKAAMVKVKANVDVINTIEGDLKKLLLKLYDEYKGDDEVNRDAFEGVDIEGVDMDALDEVSRELARQEMVEQSQFIKNEVDQYLSDKHVSILVKGFEVVKWWKGNEAAYPILSKLARDVLAIPCSTVPSENAFSLGSRIVDPFRACLSTKMVEALVCTSDWLRAEPPNFYKDPTIDELEFYYQCEELEKGYEQEQVDVIGTSGRSGNTSQTTT